MRILLFIGSLGTGGAEQQFVMLTKGLAARGHEVIPVTLYPGGQNWDAILAAETVRPASLFSRRPGRVMLAFSLFLAPLRLRSRCRDCDVIYSVLLLSNIIAWLATRGALKSHLAWGFRASSYEDPWKLRWLFRICRALSSSVRLIVVNSAPGLALLDSSGFSMKECRIIRNGIDIKRYSFDPQARESIRRQLGLDEDCIVVGMVGRLTSVKAYDIFVRAAGIVYDSAPRVRFICVGSGPVEYREWLANIPASPDLRKSILWLGDREDMPAIYSAMDIYCLASRFEGFPNALAEALACGLPCVATNVGDVELLLKDHGHIVEPDNVADLADAVLRLLDSDPTPRADIRRQSLIERFSVAQMVEDFELAFSNITAGNDVGR